MLSGLILDRLLGEPKRYHPLVGFGYLADRLERSFNRNRSPIPSVICGGIAWSLAVLPLTGLAYGLARLPLLDVVVPILALYAALGWRSLEQHAQAVVTALETGSLTQARERVGFLVSRETDAMNEADIERATVESVLENGNDALFAAMFWFIVAGAPGVVLYRLSNTLDAMWGYRNDRFLFFGRVAARLDDALNFVPARLTALCFALCGNRRLALTCWRTQASLWDSPNAGPVMAAGAGALAIGLGGPAVYHGRLHQRPSSGNGVAPGIDSISRAVRLIRRSVGLWLGVSLIVGVFIA